MSPLAWFTRNSCLLVIPVVLPAACGTFNMYPGPKRPVAEIATVKTAFLSGAIIVGVDGTHVEVGDDPVLHYEKVALLPGSHTLEVRYALFGAYGTSACRITFDAKAGHTYTVRVGREMSFREGLAVGLAPPGQVVSAGTWSAWLVEDRSGSEVARCRL